MPQFKIKLFPFALFYSILFCVILNRFLNTMLLLLGESESQQSNLIEDLLLC